MKEQPKNKLPDVKKLNKILNNNADALVLAINALALYAAPESYHAIMFIGDPPCGEFIKDFSYSKEYKRKIPGKLARETLDKINVILNS